MAPDCLPIYRLLSTAHPTMLICVLFCDAFNASRTQWRKCVSLILSSLFHRNFAAMKTAFMGIESLCSFARKCFLEQCSLCEAKPYNEISIDEQRSWTPSIAGPPHFCPLTLIALIGTYKKSCVFAALFTYIFWLLAFALSPLAGETGFFAPIN